LWLGLLVGIGFALSKIFRPKPETSSPSHGWPPLEAAIPTPTPISVPEPEIEPTVAAEEPGLVLIGDEPLQEPEPAPVAKPVAKKPAAKAAAPKKKLAPWIDPEGRICPETHPVKAKLSSMIFQVPGNFAYERTTPDRCYESPGAAEKDGLRAAKR
jgi:hypothetical protein